MSIDWFDSTKALPTVTVASYGLTLNASAAELLKDAKRVRLGLGKDCKKLYIKAAQVGEDGTFAFPDIKEEAKNVRITCKEFIQFVSLKCSINTQETEKYYATWDEENTALAIDLGKKIQRPKRKEKK